MENPPWIPLPAWGPGTGAAVAPTGMGAQSCCPGAFTPFPTGGAPSVPSQPWLPLGCSRISRSVSMAIPDWMNEVCEFMNGSWAGAGTGKDPSPPEGFQGIQDPLERGIALQPPPLPALDACPSIFPFPGAFRYPGVGISPSRPWEAALPLQYSPFPWPWHQGLHTHTKIHLLKG